MLFSPLNLSKPNVTCSKLSCKDSVATTTTILSYISLLGMTATLNHLTKNLTLANILVITFSNPLGLLIFGYMRSA